MHFSTRESALKFRRAGINVKGSTRALRGGTAPAAAVRG